MKVNMRKNILLISYNFPPIGGPRSLRWLHLLKYLGKDYLIDLLTIRSSKAIPFWFFLGSFTSISKLKSEGKIE